MTINQLSHKNIMDDFINSTKVAATVAVGTTSSGFAWIMDVFESALPIMVSTLGGLLSLVLIVARIRTMVIEARKNAREEKEHALKIALLERKLETEQDK